MIPFNSRLTNLNTIQASSLWQAVEGYLDVGQKVYRVASIEGKTICLDFNSSQPRFALTLTKIIYYFSYASILLPLCALGIREYYRGSYQFEVSDLNEPVARKSLDQPSVTAYHVDQVMDQLRQEQKKGLKLGLFVGRGHEQTLPQEEGWAWCSLDYAEMQELPEGRLHLKMDFNQSDEMQKIQNLFDKVVLDYSVLKSIIHNPWHTLKKLLVNKPHAELIAEGWASHGISDIASVDYRPEIASLNTPLRELTDYHKEEKRVFTQWKSKNEEQAEIQYQTFLNQLSTEEKNEILRINSRNGGGSQLQFMRHILKENHLQPLKIDHIPELLERIQLYLFQLFEEVNLVEGFYPYRAGNEAIRTKYWVARSPLN